MTRITSAAAVVARGAADFTDGPGECVPIFRPRQLLLITRLESMLAESSLIAQVDKEVAQRSGGYAACSR